MASDANSIDAQDPNKHDDSKKEKSKRPANTAFRQQRLKAWQPILTPKTVLPLFFITGIIFAPIGGLLLWASFQVQEISIEYTRCTIDAPEIPTYPFNSTEADPLKPIDGKYVQSYFRNQGKAAKEPTWGRKQIERSFGTGDRSTVNTTICVVEFELLDDFDPPVLFYYRLTNFYQNHRRYVKSLDPEQLKGHKRNRDQVASSDCSPLDIHPGSNKPYYPCGLIANSLFNDSFTSPLLLGRDENGLEYVMHDKNIAWSSDKDLFGKTQYNDTDVMPPPNWEKRFPGGYDSAAGRGIPDLHTDEAFQVWMRTAGLPTFSKLARRNDTAKMTKGRYRIVIDDHFGAISYGGTKSILISTRTVMGGRNPFLGIAYIVVGGLCILLGGIFTATHFIKPRKLGDHTYLSWNNEQPSAATATGRSARPGEA